VAVVEEHAPSTVPTRSAVAAYLVIFSAVGVALCTNGPALGHLRERAGVGIGVSGLVIGGQAFGFVVGSLVAGRPYDRGAGHRLLLGAGCLVVVAALSLTVVREMWQIVVVFALIGMGAAMVEVGCNTLVVWSQPPERVGSSLNALHLCFGIGALLTPLIVSRSIAWHGDLVLVPLVVAIGLVVGRWMLRGVPTPQRREESRTDAPVVSRAAFALVCVFFFLYVGGEVTFAGWLATYAEAIDLGGAQGPALLTSLFFGGFTLGRVAAVAATRRMRLDTLVVGSGVLSVVAVLALALAGDTVMVWVCTAAFGFVMGPQFASMLAFGDQRLRLNGASTSLLVAASGLGGLVPPVITGWVLDRNGAEVMPWAVLVVGLLATGVSVAVVMAGRQRPPVTSTNAPVV
jgi:FHS family Na+ dependent glucose MFS transporter 1